ncbi:glycine-rich domain-containing protein [Streptomyces sp. NPDC102278]|uniref:glycine-rich domain-containing protein n=1 Tax=Streptomyces sp. NPDC102278 TaxID=3366152 RepID=UPI003806514E
MSTPQPHPVPPPCTSKQGDPKPSVASAGTTLPAPVTPRALLSDAQFTGVMHTVLDNNPGMEADMASRIVVDALAFLAVAARTPQGLVPSRVVDEGWHALILHTHLYQALCMGLGGFVHHVPERPDPGARSHGDVERTVAAIEAAGYSVDADLWRGPEDSLITVAASCQHSGPEGPIVIIPRPKGQAGQ